KYRTPVAHKESWRAFNLSATLTTSPKFDIEQSDLYLSNAKPWRCFQEVLTMIRKRSIKDVPARFQIEIKREELDELERLRVLGGLSSKKELLNNALTLLKWAVRQKQQGYSIASVDDYDHIIRELEMPYLESVALSANPPLRVVSPSDDVGSTPKAAV